jgi:hypothetical protein
MKRTAGELAFKALSDSTKYDALEVGYAMAENLEKHLEECINNHKNQIKESDQNKFCVVMVLGKDKLLKNLIRRKFYCWPFLPKPRPNQAVFLYDKQKSRIVKRLWVLPSDMVMAELSDPTLVVDKRYKTMQKWSKSFFKGTFWEDIRKEHKLDMLSEHEFVLQHRKENLQLFSKDLHTDFTEPFDFSKIAVKKVVDAEATGL